MQCQKELTVVESVKHHFFHMMCLRERDLTFLGEFEIVTTGFGVVDFQSQLLIMKGEICSCDVMKAIKQSVAAGKISPELKQFL